MREKTAQRKHGVIDRAFAIFVLFTTDDVVFVLITNNA